MTNQLTINDSPRINDLEIVRLYCTSSESEAQVIHHRLNDEGIAARVVGQHLDDGIRATATASNVEIWVGKKQLKPASKFLRDWGIVKKPSELAKPFSVSTAAIFLTVAVGLVIILNGIQSLLFASF